MNVRMSKKYFEYLSKEYFESQYNKNYNTTSFH